MSSTFLKMMSQDDYTVISDTIAARVTNNGAVLFTKIATKQEYFFKKGQMKIIEGEPYFFYLQPELAKSAHISVRQLKGVVEKLEQEGLLFVKRSVDDTGRNYYRVNTARLIEIFNTEEEDTAEAKANYMKAQLEMNRKKEEVEKELQAMDEFLKREAEAMQGLIANKQGKKAAAAQEETAAAAVQIEDIESMLPTGMAAEPAPEPQPFASQDLPTAEPAPIPVKEPAANKRAEKKAAKKTALTLKEIWATPGLDKIYKHIENTQLWTPDLIAETCEFLQKWDYTIISRMDIDAGFIDYIQANRKQLVLKPAKYVARCIMTRAENRLATYGIDYDGTQSRVENGNFISRLREQQPDHPLVEQYDMEQAAQEEDLILV